MRKPVLIISDTHYHNFTQYSQIASSGVNTRLGDILRATAEAAKTLRELGGDTIIHCGDVFHVRGALHPSVLNPVVELYDRLIRSGFKIHMISGNHDLETDYTHRVSSSVSALESVGVHVYHQPTAVKIEDRWWAFIPWIKDLPTLRTTIKRMAVDCVVLHAPMNGVITGIPDHGLNPKDFEGLGIKYAFCGHYHNNKVFSIKDGQVVSVGALTHQNWGDVGSRAGYLLLENLGLEHRTTQAPMFCKVSVDNLDTLKDEYFRDNYIKVVDGEFTDPADIQKIKDDLLLRGAKAVVVEGLVKRPMATRGSASSGTPTIETILGDYLDRTYPGDSTVKDKALEIIRLVSDDYS